MVKAKTCRETGALSEDRRLTDFFRFPHTPHLAWLGEGSPRDDKVLSPDEVTALLAGDVVVEEKLDGANLGLSLAPDGSLRAQNRGQYLAQPHAGQLLAQAGAGVEPDCQFIRDFGMNPLMWRAKTARSPDAAARSTIVTNLVTRRSCRMFGFVGTRPASDGSPPHSEMPYRSSGGQKFLRCHPCAQ